MPVIREYTSPIDGLKTSQAGAAAIAGAGSTAANLAYYAGQSFTSAAGRVGGAVAEVYESHVVQPEIAKGATLMTSIQNDLMREWREYAQGADINDSSIADKFREERITPRMQEFVNGFQTQPGMKWAQQQSEGFQRHMNDRLLADTSTRAGLAMGVNLQSVGNNLMASVAHDPSSFDYAIAQVDQHIAALVKNSPNITPDAASRAQTELSLKMKNGIAEAYINAVAKVDPDKATQILNSGKLDKYLTGTDRVQMERYIRGENRIQEHETRQRRIEQRDQDREAVNAKVTQLMRDNIVVNPDGTTTIKPGYFSSIYNDLAKMPRVDPHIVGFALNAGRQIQHENERNVQIKSDPETYEDFARRAALPADDPERLEVADIFKAKADKRISTQDFAFFMQWANEEFRDPDIKRQEQALSKFFAAYKSTITKSSLVAADGPGDQMFYQFQKDVREAVRTGRKNGRPLGEILQQWEHPATISSYVVSPEVARQNLLGRIRGQVTSPLPPAIARQGWADTDRGAPIAIIPYNKDENLDDYLRRIQKEREKVPRGTPAGVRLP